MPVSEATKPKSTRYPVIKNCAWSVTRCTPKMQYASADSSTPIHIIKKCVRTRVFISIAAVPQFLVEQFRRQRNNSKFLIRMILKILLLLAKDESVIMQWVGLDSSTPIRIIKKGVWITNFMRIEANLPCLLLQFSTQQNSIFQFSTYQFGKNDGCFNAPRWTTCFEKNNFYDSRHDCSLLSATAMVLIQFICKMTLSVRLSVDPNYTQNHLADEADLFPLCSREGVGVPRTKSWLQKWVSLCLQPRVKSALQQQRF